MTPDTYTGPITRLDGVRPFNMNLWPTEWFWANKDLCRSYDSRWNFGIIALADGRFSTAMSVYSIQDNNDRLYSEEPRPCVFGSRMEAIRVAAARILRIARASRHWGYSFGGLEGEYLAAFAFWIRAIVAREAFRPAPRLRDLKWFRFDFSIPKLSDFSLEGLLT